MNSGNDYRENPLARTKIIATVGPACGGGAAAVAAGSVVC